MLKKPDLMKPAFVIFPNFKKMVEENRCPMCKQNIKEEDFKDELSRKEYSISGMCQICQDQTFGGGQ